MSEYIGETELENNIQYFAEIFAQLTFRDAEEDADIIFDYANWREYDRSSEGLDYVKKDFDRLGRTIDDQEFPQSSIEDFAYYAADACGDIEFENNVTLGAFEEKIKSLLTSED